MGLTQTERSRRLTLALEARDELRLELPREPSASEVLRRMGIKDRRFVDKWELRQPGPLDRLRTVRALLSAAAGSGRRNRPDRPEGSTVPAKRPAQTIIGSPRRRPRRAVPSRSTAPMGNKKGESRQAAAEGAVPNSAGPEEAPTAGRPSTLADLVPAGPADRLRLVSAAHPEPSVFDVSRMPWMYLFNRGGAEATSIEFLISGGAHIDRIASILPGEARELKWPEVGRERWPNHAVYTGGVALFEIKFATAGQLVSLVGNIHTDGDGRPRSLVVNPFKPNALTFEVR